MNFLVHISSRPGLAGVAVGSVLGLSGCGSNSTPATAGYAPPAAAGGPMPATVPATLPVDKPLVEHTVQPGESLWKLARDYDTTVKEIQAANQMTNDVIMAGKTYLIPTFKTPEGAAPAEGAPVAPAPPSAGGYQPGLTPQARANEPVPAYPSATLQPEEGARAPILLAPEGMNPAPFDATGGRQF